MPGPSSSVGEPTANFILHQDGDLIVLNKPAGVSVHNEKPSLQEMLKERGLAVSHFINRLDRETSGLVVATTDSTKVASLVEAMASGRKLYRGLVKSPRVSGGPVSGAGRPAGVASAAAFWSWSDPVSDKAEGRREPLGKARDRIASETLVKKVGGNEWFWDLEFELKTGRQHQIRKHAAHNQMPLVGDTRYGREALNRKVTETYGVDRMMLHAYRLEFAWAGRPLSFEAPLPAEFSKILGS